MACALVHGTPIFVHCRKHSTRTFLPCLQIRDQVGEASQEQSRAGVRRWNCGGGSDATDLPVLLLPAAPLQLYVRRVPCYSCCHQGLRVSETHEHNKGKKSTLVICSAPVVGVVMELEPLASGWRPQRLLLPALLQGREDGMGVRSQQQLKEEEGGGVKWRKLTAAFADVTMDLDILDCPVCFHPLLPPIFQCTVGHTICSSCIDKLPDKCHFCSLPTVYSRCHMVEHVIESIKLACSHANHGCTARITYYQKEEHEKGCPHAPCFCPETGCSFSGPTMKLLDHLTGKHKWHSGKATYRKLFGIRYQVGSPVLVGEDGHLFLVSMTLELVGGVISICCVQPHSNGSKFKYRLTLSRTAPSYSQAKEFVARSTNLHGGLPKDCIPLVVPNVLLWGTGASGIAKAFRRETGQAAKLNPARAATQAGGETEYVSCRRQCDDDDIPALETMERGILELSWLTFLHVLFEMNRHILTYVSCGIQ